MSEIQDAAQIIRVGYEGIDMTFKVGSTGLKGVQRVAAFIKGLLDKEKLTGKTAVKNLVKTGGDLEVFQFNTEDVKIVEKLAKNHGILFSILPDLNKEDGKSEILFHSEAAPRINAIIEQLKSGNIKSVEDYLDNAKEEVEELKNLKKPKKEKKTVFRELDFLAVGSYLADHKGEPVSNARKVLDMTREEIRLIAVKMQELGILKIDEDGKTEMSMSREVFKEYFYSDKWKESIEETLEEIREEIEADTLEAGKDKTETEQTHMNAKQKEALKHSKEVEAHQKKGDLNITIDRKMFSHETDSMLKTRIPYRKNEYLWFKKDEILRINDDKTIFTSLEKEKEYTIVNDKNEPLHKMTGEALYKRSYDPALWAAKRQAMEKKVQKEKAKKKAPTQKAGGR